LLDQKSKAKKSRL